MKKMSSGLIHVACVFSLLTGLSYPYSCTAQATYNSALQWEVIAHPDNPKVLVVYIDARGIPNGTYLTHVYVTVNFFDGRRRKLNSEPRRIDITVGQSGAIQRGEHSVLLRQPFDFVYVEGLQLRGRLVAEGLQANVRQLNVSPGREQRPPTHVAMPSIPKIFLRMG